MSSKWRDTTLMKKVKKENNFVCQECGSTLNIQAHHLYGKQSNELIVLCGNCHAKKHPYLAPALFSAKNIY
jgi:transcription elongation factor Elf1